MLIRKHKYIFPHQSLKRFTFRVKSSDSIFFLLDLSSIVNWFYIKSKSNSVFHMEILFISLICKETKNMKILRLKSYSKHDNVATPPPHPHNISLFEFDIKVKFPLLRLLEFPRQSLQRFSFGFKSSDSIFSC